MTPDMMVRHRPRREEARGERDASSELKMHLEVYRQRPDVAGRRARASAARRPALPSPASRSIAPCSPRSSPRSAASRSPSTRRRRPQELPDAVRQVHQGARRPAARQPRRADGRPRPFARVLQDGDDRALREDQPGGAPARRARTCSRAKKSTGCRACAACTASRRRRRSAPTTTDRAAPAAAATARWSRRRIAPRRAPRAGSRRAAWPWRRPPIACRGDDEEIRLTYRELSALIEDAVQSSLR